MKPENKKEDLRIRRTYKLLFESLLSLLSEKSFEDISVTDICEKAMIHRTTFYKHFEDKYELLKFCIKRFQNMFTESSASNIIENDIANYYLNIIKNILQFITSDNNKTHFAALLKNNSNSIATIFNEVVVEDLISKLTESSKRGIKLSVPIPIVAEFYSGALISVIRWWLENDTPLTVDELMVYADKLVYSSKSMILPT